MRKLNLKGSVYQAGELLSRGQLKQVLGGYGPQGGYGSQPCMVAAPCTDSSGNETGTAVVCGCIGVGTCSTVPGGVLCQCAEGMSESTCPN